MALHLHRADRTDLLADGLGDVLAAPLADPFAEDLVLVSARGMERWLSQRLSHVLGAGLGGDGVCAGVTFRHPSSLLAALTGTGDEDPWAPDALVWPLLEVIDAGLDAPWCATLAAHLGHFDGGEERELRLGRRYAVARRLAGLFASYARQRPQLLIDWLCGANWSTGLPPTRPTCGMPGPWPGCAPRPAICPPGCRCSVTPDCPAPTWNCSRRCPCTTTCICGCRIRAVRCGID